MSDWNLDRLRKIAGLNESVVSKKKQLNEGWADDDDGYDDEDPDVKIASEDKGQRKFERKNKKELSTADKEAAAKAAEAKKKQAEKKAAAPKAEEKKPEPKKEEPAKAEEKKEAPVEKKEEPAKDEVKAEAEKKRRGKAPNPESKAQRALAVLKNMTRGEFIKWAEANTGMGKNYASAYYAKHNPKSSRQVKEAATLFGIAHPFLKGFVLAENRELNQMQWIDADSKLEPMLFTEQAEADKIAKYMAEWKSQTAVVETFDMAEFDKE